jgi:hypothetical protein
MIPLLCFIAFEDILKNNCRVELQYSKVKSLCCFVASRINQFGVLELGFMQGWR